MKLLIIATTFFMFLMLEVNSQITIHYDEISQTDSIDYEVVYLKFSYDLVQNRILKNVIHNEVGIIIYSKTNLQGIYNSTSGEMHDSLRNQNLLPTTEPYTSLGYTHVVGGGEQAHPVVFRTENNNAIVDWMILEVRDKNNDETILASQSVLLQKDGDVVSADGISSVRFPSLSADDYYVVLRHRNHLGIMTAAPVSLSGDENTSAIDFTSPSTPTYGTNAQRNINGVMVMWSGNGNSDDRVVYQGSGSDILPITQTVFGDPLNINFEPSFPSEGYNISDYNMDGETTYQGSGSDILPITQTIFLNPANINFELSFPVEEQLPENN